MDGGTKDGVWRKLILHEDCGTLHIALELRLIWDRARSRGRDRAGKELSSTFSHANGDYTLRNDH